MRQRILGSRTKTPPSKQLAGKVTFAANTQMHQDTEAHRDVSMHTDTDIS